MKLAVLSTIITATAAFAPTSSRSRSATNTALFSSTPNPDEATTTTDIPADAPADIPQPPPAPVVAAINGWVPDDTAPCYGLPGALAPTGFFDPLGFAQKGITLNEVKCKREAEVMHGSVAMLATGDTGGKGYPVHSA